MNKISNEDLENFCSLIMSYLSKKINVSAFEKKYTNLWRNYRDNKEDLFFQMNQTYDSVFDRIFTAIDVFNPDSKSRANYEIDENQLREEVKTELLKIKPEFEKELE